MNHSAQLFIFPLFWWEHWVCLKLLIKTNTGRPHTHTCLFSPALKKKTTFTIWRKHAILHFTWDRVHLIKQALCALPLPCGKCLRQSRALSPWAAQAAEMWILHGHSSRLLFITPSKLKSGSLAYKILCVSSPSAAMSLPHRAMEK